MQERQLDYQSALPTDSSKAADGPVKVGAVMFVLWLLALPATGMGLAALGPSVARVSVAAKMAMYAFAWGWTAYPLVFLSMVLTAVLLRRKGRVSGARRAGRVPLIYLIGVALSFVAANVLGAIR